MLNPISNASMKALAQQAQSSSMTTNANSNAAASSVALQLTQAAVPSAVASVTANNSAQQDIVRLSNAGLQASATAAPVSHDGDGDGH